MSLPAPKRILIIRLSAIGDVVFASPLVSACRKRYPNAEIDWLAEGVVRPLLTDLPGLTNVILWPRQEWHDLWREKRFISLFRAIGKFKTSLKQRDYDLVVDAQGLFKSAFLAWLSRGKQRVGFKSKEPNGMFLHKRLEKVLSHRISSEYLALAEALEWDTQDFNLTLGLSSSDEARAKEIGSGEDYIVVAPFTTRPQKHWTVAHWRDLIQRLTDRGHTVGCLGGPGDRAQAEEILAGMRVRNWVGAYPLGVSAALVKYSRAIVGVDTGLTHMGVASGVPTVALFGSTCPYTETHRDRVRIIYHDLECAPCSRRPTCSGRYDCMSGIQVDEVLKEFDQVAEAAQHRPITVMDSEGADDE